MKVRVELDQQETGWSVTVEIEGGLRSPIVHELRTVDGPVDPVTGAPGFVVPILADDSADADVGRVGEALATIRTRGDLDWHVECVGRHLFDILLGKHWVWLQEQRTAQDRDVLLLTLCWDADQDVLNRLPWEAMYDGEARSYLATHRTLDVATARVVRGATAEAQVVDEVPRVLFVICSGMDDAVIRPGLELMGLLRELERGERSIVSKVRVAPTLTKLQTTVRQFRPHVVHLVGHGEERSGVGGILLKPTDSPEIHVDARKLAPILSYPDGDDTRPVGLVVLSSCDGASSWSPSASPLAAELVKEGTPMVVAMAGEVSDVACRLFTRRFAESVMSGDAVATAAAEGRRAAYFEGEPPSDSIDWALPTLFVAEGTPPDIVPLAHPQRLLAANALAPKVGVDLPAHRPVFCARQEFIDTFDQILDGTDGLRVLVAYASPDLDEHGPNRLVKELGHRALRQGHLPILVGQLVPSKEPRTPVAVAVKVLAAAYWAAHELRIDPGGSKLLTMILGHEGDDGPASLDDRYVRFTEQARQAARIDDDIDPENLRLRLAEDLMRVHKLAVAEHPHVFDAGRTPVVLMSHVHMFDKGTDALFAERGLLGANGFGSSSPIPAVLTAAYDDLNSAKLADARSHQKASRQFIQLRKFPVEGDEDLLIYQWVLMNPRPGLDMPPLTAEATSVVYAARNRDGPWRELLREKMSRTPRDFDDVQLYDLAQMFVKYKDFCANNDERTWANFVEKQRS